MKVKDVMSKHLIVCEKNNIYEASNLMKKYDIGFLPIVVDKKIVSVITDRDIVVNCLYNHSENINLNNSVKFIDENASLEETTDLMKKYKVKRLLVFNNGRIVGVVSISDIVQSIDKDLFVDTFKTIYEIDKNEHDYDVEIDEFYL